MQAGTLRRLCSSPPRRTRPRWGQQRDVFKQHRLWRGLLLSFHRLPLSFHRLPLSFHRLPLSFHHLSCLPATSFLPFLAAQTAPDVDRTQIVSAFVADHVSDRTETGRAAAGLCNTPVPLPHRPPLLGRSTLRSTNKSRLVGTAVARKATLESAGCYSNRGRPCHFGDVFIETISSR